jgi:hypothetical protein
MEENPHARNVAEIFRIARNDYGRIDYTFVNGRLQTYEINLNPTVINAGPLERTQRSFASRKRSRRRSFAGGGQPDGGGMRPRCCGWIRR